LSINQPKTEDTREAARRYLRAGLAAIPVPPGTKNPNRRAWQTERWTLEDVPRVWADGENVGVLTGEPSGWVVDVDLDCPEAVKIAGRFLPPTLTSGRDSVPDSHWWYRCQGLRSQVFEDLRTGEREPDKVMEIRSTGQQTLVAPSRHPEGDRYRWSGSGLEMAEVETRDLLRECRMLATAALVARVLPRGGRHRFGLALAGFLLRRGLDPETVEKIMHAGWDASEAGFASEKARREAHRDLKGIVSDTAEKLADGEEIVGEPTLEELRDGLPRKIRRYWGWRRSQRRETTDADSTAPAKPGFNRTDLGNAERLVARHGEDLRYCHPWRKALVWDVARWAEDTTGAVDRLAAETVRSIYDEAEHEPDPDVRKALARHAIASEARSRIDAMGALARSKVPVKPEELDRDPWLLNCSNGTVDLRTGDLREHSREDLITKFVPVEYDAEAEAPIFEAFLERVLPSEALRGFVQRVFGYAALGVVTEEILVIFHGTGDNGKTTLMNVILEALGDYAIQAARDLLLAKRGTHPTELTDLFGTRLVACTETDDGRRLAEALVKQLTGRERIRARGMREDFWEFDPTHTVFLSTNHKPEIRGTDHAIWRRIKLVPFEVRIPDDEKDKELSEKLREELPGILAWIVRGCLDYQELGLGEPDQVEKATAGYRAEMDVLAAFIEDRCVLQAGAETPATPLYKAYREWCEEAGEQPEKQTAFGRRLGERGDLTGFSYTQGPHKGRKGWRGIGLLQE
jgi:putative DNA primase/helicase